jgi:hypothetical protein
MQRSPLGSDYGRPRRRLLRMPPAALAPIALVLLSAALLGCGGDEPANESDAGGVAASRSGTVAGERGYAEPEFPHVVLRSQRAEVEAEAWTECDDVARGCSSGDDLKTPESLVVARAGETLEVAIPGTEPAEREVLVRPLACRRRLVDAFVLPEGDPTWTVDLPAGAYELDVASAVANARLRGSVEGALLGLLVSPTETRATVPAARHVFCTDPDEGVAADWPPGKTVGDMYDARFQVVAASSAGRVTADPGGGPLLETRKEGMSVGYDGLDPGETVPVFPPLEAAVRDRILIEMPNAHPTQRLLRVYDRCAKREAGIFLLDRDQSTWETALEPGRYSVTIEIPFFETLDEFTGTTLARLKLTVGGPAAASCD